MTSGEIIGPMLRGLHLAALVSLFGTLVFSAVVLRGSAASLWMTHARARLARLLRVSTALALVSGAAWFAERAGAMASASTMADAAAALPVVLWNTRFGHVMLVRAALLLMLAAASRQERTRKLAILLAAGALGLQTLTSHVGAMEGAVGQGLLISELLHVLAAGAWVGGLLPLLVVLAGAPAQSAAGVLRRFFPLGLTAVSVVGVTSVVQAVHLIGDVPALVGTAYGQMALIKLALFLSMLGFAAMNRFAFGASPGVGLRRSIIGETVFAAALMLAAGSLAYLTPGIHEQAKWPFAWRINPDRAGALLIPANPASYLVSPTGFAAGAIVRGEGVFRAACIGCHGVAGQGDGVVARTLPVAPADLTARRLLEFTDGELYWRAGHAVELDDDARWQLVDYLRAHNRGEFLRSAGRGVQALLIPRFSATCDDGRNLAADDLRGQVLRIIVPGPGGVMPALQAGAPVKTVALSAVLNGPCLAQPEALAAFSILLATTPGALAGTQFLIDPNGWLRGRWRPGEAGGWGTLELLLARVQALADRPLPLDAAVHPHHH